MLSHELRTPLSAIVGWAHMLRTGGLDEATAARAIETIDRNAKVQNQLIEDILDVSRIVAGKFHLDMRTVDLVRVVEAACDTVAPTAGAKGVTVRQELAPEVRPVCPAIGDPDRLQQVVWNLLSNAIKFTPRGGVVTVELRRREPSSELEIVVRDTGTGITADFLPHIFERFRQAGTGARRHGGLGLGLSIVRHIVEMHGGTVDATSGGEGQGSAFTVCLPFIDAAAEGERVLPLSREEAGLEQAPRLDGVRVLVVEDEADARHLLAAVLQKRGARVYMAASAAEALEVLQRERPDVLLSDIALQDRDGYDLIRQVRALPAEGGGRIPAAALTGYGRLEDRMRALSAGFQLHAAKPVEPAELVAVVASLAGKSAP
jgi:CheY-like chemotaxis protein